MCPNEPRKWKKVGAELRASFLRNLPALAKVKEYVAFQTTKRGWLRGLDGRPLPVRSEHMALNTLLQSGGAVVMKKALVLMDQSLQEKGFVPGQDYELVASVHDEEQMETRSEEMAHIVGKTMVEAIRQAGVCLNVRCPLDGEYKIGKNWKETH